MNKDKVKKVVRNLLIILLILKFSGLYFTPIGAYRALEESMHYGPAKIIHKENYSGGKAIVGKYETYLSTMHVERVYGVFYKLGNANIRMNTENQEDVPVIYSSSVGRNYATTYGIIQDEQITEIEIELQDGTKLAQTKFYDEDVFFFLWKPEGQWRVESIKGFSEDGQLRYKENIN